MFKHEEDTKDIISAAKLGSKGGSMKEYLESKKKGKNTSNKDGEENALAP